MASVTVTIYNPAVKPLIAAVVIPPGCQVIEYGAVPPEVVTDAVPSLPNNSSVDVVVIERAVGSVTVTVVVDEHPFASVTVYVCVPAIWDKEPIPV